MKAHYIPRFYLAGFTDLATPQGREPFLHVFEFDHEAWRRAAPKKVATLPDYYTVQLETGEKHEDLEHALSKLESVAATILRTQIAAGAQLTHVERVHLAEFVGAMLLRVPAAREATAELMAKEGQQLLADLHAAVTEDPEILDQLFPHLRASTSRHV